MLSTTAAGPPAESTCCRIRIRFSASPAAATADLRLSSSESEGRGAEFLTELDLLFLPRPPLGEPDRVLAVGAAGGIFSGVLCETVDCDFSPVRFFSAGGFSDSAFRSAVSGSCLDSPWFSVCEFEESDFLGLPFAIKVMSLAKMLLSCLSN